MIRGKKKEREHTKTTDDSDATDAKTNPSVAAYNKSAYTPAFWSAPR